MNYIFTMLLWWVMAGWILDFQYCKWVLNFLHYFFNVNKAFYSILSRNIFQIVILCIGVSTPIQKHPPPPFLPSSPPLNLQTVQAPFLSSLSSIGFLWTFHKSGIFQWTPKISKFFILSTILSFKSNKILTWNFPVWILSYDRKIFLLINFFCH